MVLDINASIRIISDHLKMLLLMNDIETRLNLCIKLHLVA